MNTNANWKKTVAKKIICDIHFHRASLAKHLRSKKHLENLNHQEKTIPEWLFQEPQEIVYIITRRIYNPLRSREKSGQYNETDDGKQKKNRLKRGILPYYFNDRVSQIGFVKTLNSHHINQANCIFTVKPN